MIARIVRLLCCALLLAGLFPGLAARADQEEAPFDCRDPGPDPATEAACRKFADALAEMKPAYDAAVAPLSPGAAAILAAGQESWRAATRTICRPAGDADAARFLSCLGRAFSQRAVALGDASPRIGPFQFLTVEQHAARRVAGGPALFSRDNVNDAQLDVGYPRIDNAGLDAMLRAQIEQWNAATARRAEAERARFTAADGAPKPGEATISVRIRHAESDFISLDWQTRRHDVQAPRSLYELRHDNRWIGSGHPLQATDLFDGAAPWAEALTMLAVAKIDSCDTVDDDSEAARLRRVILRHVILRQAANPAYWSITPAALEIAFDHGDARRISRIAIPWRRLKPYLIAPFPLHVSLD